MTAKEYLNRISVLEDEIKRKQQRCRTLRDVAMNTSVNNSNDVVQTTRDKNPLEKILTKVIDLDREIEADEARLVDLKAEVWEQLDKLTDERHKRILWIHYAERKTWNKVAGEMYVSRRHMLRLHKDALDEFDKILKLSPLCHPNVILMSPPPM